MPRRNATGIVLAGGAGTRMGTDKAALSLGGVTLVERAVAAVARVCGQVIVASGGRTIGFSPSAGIKEVPDPPGAAGPLAGLVAGMRAAPSENFILLACDMPFASPRLLAYLLESIDGRDAAVPSFDGQPQPLQAAYSRNCLEAAESLLQTGNRSMTALLDRLSVRFIGGEELARIDVGGLSGFNVNRPEDLARARQLLATPPHPAVA